MLFYVKWMATNWLSKSKKSPCSWRELGRIAGLNYSWLYMTAKRYKETRTIPALDVSTVAGIAHAYETITRQNRLAELKSSLDPKPKRKRRAKNRKSRNAKTITKRTRRSSTRCNPGDRSGSARDLAGNAGS